MFEGTCVKITKLDSGYVVETGCDQDARRHAKADMQAVNATIAKAFGERPYEREITFNFQNSPPGNFLSEALRQAMADHLKKDGEPQPTPAAAEKPVAPTSSKRKKGK